MEKINQMFHGIWNAFYQSVLYDDRYKYLLEGLLNTVFIAVFAVLLGIVIGSMISLICHYHEETKKLKIPAFLFRGYVHIIRGTPVILQLMIIYYVIFKSVNVPLLLVGVLAFGINSSAYVSEIIRAGLSSIPRGQFEAGYALGLSYGKTMRYIIFPQAIKNILPALGNEFITLLKETSVGAYIGIIELTKASDIIASRTYDYFFPLFIIALIYLFMTLGLTKLIRKLERRMQNARS